MQGGLPSTFQKVDDLIHGCSSLHARQDTNSKLLHDASIGVWICLNVRKKRKKALFVILFALARVLQLITM